MNIEVDSKLKELATQLIGYKKNIVLKEKRL